MKIILTIGLLFCSVLISEGQNQVNYWMGGSHSMIKFDGTGAHYEYRADDNLFENSSASISDTTGNLLFYTNGFRVFNRNFEVMQNGDSLNIGDYVNWGYGLLSIEDGAAIIPVIANRDQYYLFHVDLDLINLPNYPNTLMVTNIYYSVIDMRLDNGKGGIVKNEKDIPILNDTLTQSGIKMVKHANGRDWWLLCHKYNTNRYYRFLIDPYGIHGPYLQNIGMVYEAYDMFSPSKFSIDGEKFVQLTEDSNIFELYDFDRCSGQLYNYERVKVNAVNDSTVALYGVSFSTDNRYVYVTSTFNQILQFDITNADIFSTRTRVGDNNGITDPFYPMFYLHQLGPDGKLYIVDYNGCYSISTINYPDSAGLSCDFVQQSFPIDSPSTWFASCPNVPNYSLGPLIGSTCDTIREVNPVFTWSVYPNPFAEQLNVSITGATTPAILNIFNLLGQQINYTQIVPTNYFANDAIHLSSLASGMYIVRIEVNGRQYEQKVVKI